jgi:hypothetical protein
MNFEGPTGRDRHSGFETYHERPFRRAKVNQAVQVRCRRGPYAHIY